MGTYRRKRALDLVVTIPLLVATAPLQAAIALTLRARLGKPVLFRQVRPGLHGKPFQLLKFRTMLNPDPDRGLTTDASRMTALGRQLRATSLDELPTLWNVIRGDMSLVGPRPLLTEYLDRYDAEQARRHDVRPGVTGLAQVSGRNSLDWETRLKLDVVYVDTSSFRGDLQILLKTVGVVVRRTGVTGADSVTMSQFLGTGTTGEGASQP